MDKKENEFINFMYKVQNRKPNLCLFGDFACQKKAIKAHSLQNSKVFELISQNGHLFSLGIKYNSIHLPEVKWIEKGRNVASTFTGLCGKHDNDIFTPIEKVNIDFSNNEHLFLFAYRAVYKGYHENVSAAYKIQSLYLKKIDLGEVSGNDYSKEGEIATGYLVNMIDSHIYKLKFDQIFKEQNWGKLCHKVIVLDNQYPTIACSQLFSIDYIRGEEDVLRIILNVIPVSETRTYVVYSYGSDERELAENYIDKKVRGSGYLLKYNISKSIIENTSNFFISPKVYNLWSFTKKEKIKQTFEETILEFKDIDSPELYLFK